MYTIIDIKGKQFKVEKDLELNGVGFRANLKGEELILSLGFSHEVKYKVPKGIVLKIEKQTKIKITGTDKELVSKTASEIKSIKPEASKP